MFVSIAKKLLLFLSTGPRGAPHGVKTDTSFPHTIKRRNANCICHILRRNRLLNHFVERNVEGRIDVKEDEEEDVSSY
jgi:hypothetical protein